MSVSFDAEYTPDYVGPLDPLAPIGETETIESNPEGPEIRRLEFADGWLYEIKIRRGSPFDACRFLDVLELQKGVWHGVFNPWHEGDLDNETLHLSVWVGREKLN